MPNQFSKKYTEQDYINKCNDLCLLYIGNHKEKKVGTVIDFVCKKHEDKGIQHKDWSHFRTYTYGCSYCSGRNKTNKDIELLIKDKNVLLISEYIGNEKPIDCKCKACGNIWTTLPKVLISNGSGCPKCGKKKAIKAETKTREKFIEEINMINPNIEILGEYINTHTKIECKCKICKTTWYGYPSNLLNKSAGCIGCNISIGEKKMLDILNKIGIKYIPQYPIKTVKNMKPQRFDAFDIINNIAFEYNGEQHYYPVDFAGKGKIWAEEQFTIIKKRDQLKIEYCRNNNIPIVIIPYWERDNIEYFILLKLKELNIELA